MAIELVGLGAFERRRDPIAQALAQRLVARTPRTIADPVVLGRPPACRVREEGVAFDRGESDRRMLCAAAPIKRRDGLEVRRRPLLAPGWSTRRSARRGGRAGDHRPCRPCAATRPRGCAPSGARARCRACRSTANSRSPAAQGDTPLMSPPVAGVGRSATYHRCSSRLEVKQMRADDPNLLSIGDLSVGQERRGRRFATTRRSV
jgi:hypothetical protein